jgi:hypothetical protein
MRSFRSICCSALAAGVFLIGGLQGAISQTVDVRQACTPDAMRLCSEFVPDEAKVTACMHRKYAQIGPECRSAMAAGRRGQGHHARHHYHHSH